jgi:hypothetical protein
MTDKRRASRGCTHEPYPCCGAEPGAYGRPKGTICRDCESLIADGMAARAAAATAQEAGQRQVFRWTSQKHGWPRFYGAGCQWPAGDGLDDALVDAFWQLVTLVADPAPADTPRDSPKYEMVARAWSKGKERQYLPWPMVLSEGGYGSWSFEQLVLLPANVQQALDTLHQAIKAALGGVYQEGKERGGSALLRLASGELSLQDFDDTLRPAESKKHR